MLACLRRVIVATISMQLFILIVHYLLPVANYTFFFKKFTSEFPSNLKEIIAGYWTYIDLFSRYKSSIKQYLSQEVQTMWIYMSEWPRKLKCKCKHFSYVICLCYPDIEHVIWTSIYFVLFTRHYFLFTKTKCYICYKYYSVKRHFMYSWHLKNNHAYKWDNLFVIIY